MMSLQETIPNREFDDRNRFDFLIGIHSDVLRMDEVHPSVDDDWHHVFLVWLKETAEPDEFVAKIFKNLADTNNGWSFHVKPFGQMVIIQCEPLF